MSAHMNEHSPQRSRSTGLYPEILFHFTDKEKLFKILENNFALSYATETIYCGNAKKGLGVPMVSFCDLRLSELKQHIKTYGPYGIGLTKQWANTNGLNPVFYVSQFSPAAKDFMDAIDNIYRHLDREQDGDKFNDLAKSYMKAFNLFRYIKNYQGDLVRKSGEVVKDYRFANEREWRYVPQQSLNDIELAFVPPDKINTDEKKAAMNARWNKHPLIFNPEDIRYLIVESDEERLELIEHLQRVKERFDWPVVQRLASRILDVNQIMNDV